MDRLFLDANVLYSAAHSPGSVVTQLWLLASEKSVVLVTSTYAVAETVRNLKTAAQIVRLEKLLRQVEVRSQPPSTMMPAGLPELPEKDRPILFAAIVVQATHLVTGDVTHFGSLYGRTVQGVLIVTPSEYLK